MFVHDDRDFDRLLRIVAEQRRLTPALVEKDYWVTHTLWALHAQGFEIWFKGGTSLSKGFGLIERFSEDLDLRIEPGTIGELAFPANWKSKGTNARTARAEYFRTLAKLLDVPGTKSARLDEAHADGLWRNADLEVLYPGRHMSGLGVLSPFVRLEVGVARVTPFVPRDLTSFVHEQLAAQDQLREFDDNRPKAVRCVHPLVTLIEKLDALHRAVPNEQRAAATFVRHFEDAARIIRAAELPALEGYPSVPALVAEMLDDGQIRQVPRADDLAFAPDSTERWDAVRSAHAEAAQLHWGERIDLGTACDEIRGWIGRALA